MTFVHANSAYSVPALKDIIYKHKTHSHDKSHKETVINWKLLIPSSSPMVTDQK